jgi:hypothetical protein
MLAQETSRNRQGASVERSLIHGTTNHKGGLMDLRKLKTLIELVESRDCRVEISEGKNA